MPTAQGLQRGGQIARAVRTGVTSGRLRRDSPISHHSSPVSRRGATGRQRDSSSIPGAQRRHAVAARPGPHRRAAHGHREQRGRVISRARRGQDSRSRRTVRRPPAIGCVQRWKPPTSSTGPPSSRATSARARARACGGLVYSPPSCPAMRVSTSSPTRTRQRSLNAGASGRAGARSAAGSGRGDAGRGRRALAWARRPEGLGDALAGACERLAAQRRTHGPPISTEARS